MRLRFRSLALLSLPLAAAVQAQTPAFRWAASLPLTLGPNAQGNRLQYAVAAHPDGGAIVAGQLQTTNNYGSAIFGKVQLLRYRADGSVAWSKTFNGNSLTTQLRTTPGGGFVLLGQYLDSVRFSPQHVLQAPSTNYHTYLAVFDSTGSVTWTKDFFAQYGTTYVNRAIAIDAQGQLAVAYRTGLNTIIQVFDPAGTPVRQLQQNGIGQVSSLAFDVQGNLFVSGGCVPAAGGTFNGTFLQPLVSGNGYNKYLVRYRPSGVLAWAKFVNDVTCTDNQVLVDANGEVYWSGLLHDAAQMGSITLPGPMTGSTSDFFIARLDTAGNYLWARDVPPSQTSGTYIGKDHFIDLDAAGNLLFTGTTRGSINWGNGWATSPTSYYDLLVLRCSPAGVIEWAKLAGSTGGSDNAHQISVAPNGSMYLVGTTRGTALFDSLSITGPTTSDYPYVAALGMPAILSRPAAAAVGQLRLFPNPAVDQLAVTFADGTLPEQVQLLDATGRQVQVPLTVTAGRQVLQTAALPAGLYLLRALHQGRWYTAQAGKL